MKKDDRLIDELLKEHARGGADEGFLRDVEERIDAEGKVVEMRREPSAGNRWALGAGVAACLAVGAMGIYFWGERGNEDIVAYEVEAPAGQVESAVAYSEVPSEDLMRDNETRRPAVPSSSMAKKPIVEEFGDRVGRQQHGGDGKVVSGAAIPNANYHNDSVVPMEEKRKIGLDDDGGFGSHGDRKEDNRTISAKDRARFNELARDYEEAEEELRALQKQKENLPAVRKQEGILAERKKRLTTMSERTGIPYTGRRIEPAPVRERYGELVENEFKAPVDERSALSTFAVDVDTASYANVRRMLGQGMRVPKDSVRIEEMVNYFDYSYPQPDGAHPFSVNVDSMACPWADGHRLVRIGLQGKEIVRTERPAANLVFLLDVSGSMNSADKLPLLKKSMGFLLEELNEKDSVSIVVYAGASGLALPATKMDAEGRRKVAQAMDRLSAGGSTAGGRGIKLAYEVAKKEFVKDGVNRIILATDGDFNVGVSSDGALTELVKGKAKEGTYLSVLGFGSGNINDSMLEKITNSGNGNYSYIDSVKEGRKVLLEDMMGTMVTIAKDVKVQVVMNPKKVKAYRLIGYSNRMLPPEAFLDKKVDAGEIGAGHTVTALYEIIPADGKPFGPEIDGGRYFEKPEAAQNPAVKDSDETMFVKLAYKKPDEQMDDESTYLGVPFTDAGGGVKEAAADLKFAGAVGLFGMVLRDSEFRGKGDLEMVLELARAGRGKDGKGLRGEFMDMVRKLSERK